MFFTVRDLPIQHFPPAIRPEAECHQDYHFAACALLTLPIAFIWLDLLLLTLDGDPNAIQLDHRRHVSERSCVRALGQGFNLIDPLIERAQPDTSLNHRAPALSHLTHTLTKTT